MPSFSVQSKLRLQTCHEDLQVLFNEVIKFFDCVILEGHRGQEAQDKAFAEGKSKLKWPSGQHNAIPSMAVDVAPYDKASTVDWQDVQRFHYFAGQVMCLARILLAQGKIKHAVRWGGDWDRDTEIKDEKFRDLPHFELRGVT